MKQCGKQTACLENPVPIGSSACVAGKKEGQGPLGATLDTQYEDGLLGLKSWEQAESAMQKDALNLALSKGKYTESSLRFILAGDLLGQCIGSAFGIRGCAVPFLGLYGACSTMAQSLGLGALLVDGGYADRVGVVTSSHFCGSERQFRLPLEYGGQRAPTAQWTVTGAGAAILEKPSAVSGCEADSQPQVSHVTFGKIVDMGIKDVSYMGAAMAPAAFDTLSAHFADCGTAPEDYDLIVTGDLGSTGADILRDLFAKNGVSLGSQYTDCGVMIFDLNDTDAGDGGSGCGCSAVVLCGHILNGMRDRQWRNVLFCGTGALFSTVSAQQGESIPSICHAVRIVAPGS
ncbi:MAG: stage V sporulation protein AD [Oscillospiraceae bacterium]|nr:stage V sporulation protein AD [Oscillospiraceae bacterium]